MIRTIILSLAVTVAFVPIAWAQNVPSFRMRSLDEPMQPKAAPAVDCASMDTRLRTALAAFTASCQDDRYRSQLQQCRTIETETLAAAEQLLPYAGTCPPWTTAIVKNNIAVTREGLANIANAMAFQNAPRPRRNTGGGGGYYGPSTNTYVGPDIGYSACQRFTILADGSKSCY